MKIQFLGATRTVTGSCYLLETNNKRILIDCGMYQGADVDDRNYEEFSFDPKSIDYVILTHAHLDHCGLLPKLAKRGYRGKVYMSIPTRMIVEHMLLDSAKIQEMRFKNGKKKSKKRNNDWALKQLDIIRVPFREPIYDTVDVYDLLAQSATVDFNEEIPVDKQIAVSFFRAGHALGAASVRLRITEEGKDKIIVFSGDLGNTYQRLDSQINYANEADFVVMESLYGAKIHENRDGEEEKLAQAINKTYERFGNILIPAFTLQRSQEILYVLKNLITNGRIPKDVRIFLDSPLAVKITDIYKQFFSYLNPTITKEYSSGENLFSSPNFVFVANENESRKIRNYRRSIIIACNGMCAGGRIIYHLTQNLADKRSSIIFVGYQAKGTLGREILEGAKQVTIGQKSFKVKSEIISLNFSAHADKPNLLTWINSIDKSKVQMIYLTHAEEEVSFAFKEQLESQGFNVLVPEWQKEYDLV